MGWRTIVVNQHSKLSYQNNHLVFKSSEHYETIHLSEIDILLLETTNITISTMLLKRLLDFHILVLFCDDKRLPVSKLEPFYGRHDSTLQLQKQLNWQMGIKEQVWTTIIIQKITNQSDFLSQRDFYDKSGSLFLLKEEVLPFDPSNREGHAARIYFNTLFGNDFTREQDNAVNASLNYGYTLLMSLFAREIVRNGCLTQLGLKHSNQFNDFNLASDIMEPFRPIVDDIVYANKHQPFPYIKRQLLSLFSETYSYQGKGMFLTNIVSDYTKKVIKVLNNEGKGVPVFRI